MTYQETRAERAVYLETLVTRLQQIHAELGIEDLRLGFKITFNANNDVSLDGSALQDADGGVTFTQDRLTEVENRVREMEEEREKRDKEVEELEGELHDIVAELGEAHDLPSEADMESRYVHSFASLFFLLPSSFIIEFRLPALPRIYSFLLPPSSDLRPLTKSRLNLTSSHPHRLYLDSIARLHQRISHLSDLRATRQAVLAALAEKITVLWDQLDVPTEEREAFVKIHNGKLSDYVITACGTFLS